MPRDVSRPATPIDCPCGGGRYVDCCGPFHAGAAAPTAEALMRSRYSAFAVGDAAYLTATWHPDHRPDELDLADGKRWTRLEILDTGDGSPFHRTGTVTFRAAFRHRGEDYRFEEKSRFERVDGSWVYVDAEFVR